MPVTPPPLIAALEMVVGAPPSNWERSSDFFRAMAAFSAMRASMIPSGDMPAKRFGSVLTAYCPSSEEVTRMRRASAEGVAFAEEPPPFGDEVVVSPRRRRAADTETEAAPFPSPPAPLEEAPAASGGGGATSGVTVTAKRFA